MDSHTLERKLKRIKRGFRVYRNYAVNGGTAEAYSSLYLDEKFLFGLPLGEMPEYTIRDAQERIIIRGWKNAVKNLVDENHIRLRDAERVFEFSIGRKLREWDKHETRCLQF